MVRVRIGDRELRFPEVEWEAHVSEGEVPPDALVFSLELTDGLWQRADRVSLYEFFRKSGEEDRREAALTSGGVRAGHAAPPFVELPRVVLPRNGLSGTEILFGLNVLVAGLLVLFWRGEYTTRIWDLAWTFHEMLRMQFMPAGLLATLFMHADLGHLGANMISLVPSAAFAEYLYGRRVLLIYLIGGLAGGCASFWLKGHGPMSVGASGAVYALIGAFGGFVLRNFGDLPRWHRWKARRIYIPALLLVTLPSILHADWRAHTGGFLAGVLIGLLLPLDARGRRLLLTEKGD